MNSATTAASGRCRALMVKGSVIALLVSILGMFIAVPFFTVASATSPKTAQTVPTALAANLSTPAQPANPTVPASNTAPANNPAPAPQAATETLQTAPAAPAFPTKDYIVPDGSNLTRVSKQHGMTLEQFLELNPSYRAHPDSVRAGAKVTVRADAQPALQPAPSVPAAPAPEPKHDRTEHASPSGWVHPLGHTARCSSGMGPRWGKQHKGFDLPVPVGTPLYAVANGVVDKETGPANGFGRVIVINHDDGTVSEYGHVNTIKVKIGDHVKAGEKIGESGNRGHSTGPHLHIEFRQGEPFSGKLVNPQSFLKARGIQLCASRD